MSLLLNIVLEILLYIITIEKKLKSISINTEDVLFFKKVVREDCILQKCERKTVEIFQIIEAKQTW